MAAMRAEQQNLLAHNKRLEKDLKERTKNGLQYKNLYEKLKHAQQQGNVELAAEQDADNVLLGASQHASNQYRNTQMQQPGHPRPGHGAGSNGSDERRQRMTLQPGAGYGVKGYAPTGSRGVGTSHSVQLANRGAGRPRLPQPTFGNYDASLLGRGGTGIESLRQGTPRDGGYRYGAGQGGSPGDGYGLSAGVRVGRPSATGFVPPSRGGPGRPSGYGAVPMR